MISFDLKCSHGHVFEAWFRSGADYEAQQLSGQIACPICSDVQVAKAVMAPAITAKSNQRSEPVVTGQAQGNAAQAMTTGDSGPTAEQMKVLMSALAEAQAKMLEKSEWVGNRFAERARAMHYGEADHAPIHGTAEPQEARAMLEEGLAVAPLLVPVAPPDRTH